MERHVESRRGEPGDGAPAIHSGATSPQPLRERHDTHHHHHDADDEGRTSEAAADAELQARVAEDARRDRPDQEYGVLHAEPALARRTLDGVRCTPVLRLR